VATNTTQQEQKNDKHNTKRVMTVLTKSHASFKQKTQTTKFPFLADTSTTHYTQTH